MGADDLDQVLELLGVRPGRVVVLRDIPLANGNWLVDAADRRRLVLRRYHPQVTRGELGYEHAVLGYLADAGWVVPAALGQPVRWQGRWYCLTRYVPGEAVRAEDPGQRRRRGRDLARLHLALRGAAERLGQRPEWRAQHGDFAAWNVHYDRERLSRTATAVPLGRTWATITWCGTY